MYKSQDLSKGLLDEENQASPESDFMLWVRLIATCVAVSLGSSLQFGFATGSLNNLEQIVPESLADLGSPISVTQWALINSLFSVGGIIGSYGVVVPLAMIGRRRTLLAANFFVFLSSALMFYGTTPYVLMLGRISIGVVAGVAQMVAGSYMTEIAPISIRGSVGVCSQVGIVIGIAFANLLTAPSFDIFGSPEKWRYTFLVPSLFSLFQLLVLPFCPESPSYIIKSQGSQLALATLSKLHREFSAQAHLSNLKRELVEGGAGADDFTIMQLLQAKNLRKQVLVGIVIKIGVQFSGIDAIFYYSTLMFRHADVPDPQLATFLLSIVNLAMTFIAMGIMEKAGRRPLIMTTWVGMCSGFAVIFLANTAGEVFGIAPTFMALTQVVAMVTTIMSFAVGVGNVEGFIISEIMPVYAKDTLMSIGQPLNWVANLAVSTMFPILFAAIGRNIYLIFVGLTFFFGWFTHHRLPETKGKTIQEVTRDFAHY
jgi:SP family facilitated glucose transporter-like MFS transporter 1